MASSPLCVFLTAPDKLQLEQPDSDDTGQTNQWLQAIRRSQRVHFYAATRLENLGPA